MAPGRQIGWAGVDLFFVLSGFLIGGLLMREVQGRGRIDASRFLLRRAYKLWPNYLVFLLLAGVVFRPSRVAQIVPNFVHLQNYLGTPIAHTWSLAVEEHFYVLFALAVAFLARRREVDFHHVRWICLGCVAIALVSRLLGTYLGESPQLLDEATHNRIDTLALGILLASLYRFRPEAFERMAGRRRLLASVALAGVAFAAVFAHDSTPMHTVGFDVVALAAAATVVLFFSSRPGVGVLGKARQTRIYLVVASVGYYSYGIYLWHLSGVTVYSLLARRAHLPESLDATLGNVVYLFLAIGIGVASTKLIEEPMLRLRERRAPARNAGLAYEAPGPSPEPAGRPPVEVAP